MITGKYNFEEGFYQQKKRINQISEDESEMTDTVSLSQSFNVDQPRINTVQKQSSPQQKGVLKQSQNLVQTQNNESLQITTKNSQNQLKNRSASVMVTDKNRQSISQDIKENVKLREQLAKSKKIDDKDSAEVKKLKLLLQESENEIKEMHSNNIRLQNQINEFKKSTKNVKILEQDLQKSQKEAQEQRRKSEILNSDLLKFQSINITNQNESQFIVKGSQITQIEQAQKKIRDLEDIISQYKEKKDVSISENIALQQKVAEYVYKQKNLEMELSHAQKVVKAKEADIIDVENDYKEELEKNKTMFTNYQLRLDQLNQDKLNLEQLLQKKDDLIESQRQGQSYKQLDRMETNILDLERERLLDQIDKITIDRDNQKQDIKKLELKIYRYKDQRSRLNTCVEKFDYILAENERLQGDLKFQADQNKVYVSKLISQMDDLKAQIKNHSIEKQLLKDEIKQEQLFYNQLAENLEIKNQEYQQLSDHLNQQGDNSIFIIKLNQQLSEANQRITAQADAYNAKEEEFNQISRLQERTENELRSAVLDMNLTKEDNERLKHQMQIMEHNFAEEIHAFNHRTISNENEIINLQHQLEIQEMQFQETIDKLTSATNAALDLETQNLRSMIDDQKAKNLMLENILQERTKELINRDNHIQTLEDRLNKYKDQYYALEQDKEMFEEMKWREKYIILQGEHQQLEKRINNDYFTGNKPIDKEFFDQSNIQEGEDEHHINRSTLQFEKSLIENTPRQSAVRVLHQSDFDQILAREKRNFQINQQTLQSTIKDQQQQLDIANQKIAKSSKVLADIEDNYKERIQFLQLQINQMESFFANKSEALQIQIKLGKENEDKLQRQIQSLKTAFDQNAQKLNLMTDENKRLKEEFRILRLEMIPQSDLKKLQHSMDFKKLHQELQESKSKLQEVQQQSNQQRIINRRLSRTLGTSLNLSNLNLSQQSLNTSQSASPKEKQRNMLDIQEEISLDEHNESLQKKNQELEKEVAYLRSIIQKQSQQGNENINSLSEQENSDIEGLMGQIKLFQ